MKTFAEMLNDPARPFSKDMRDAVEAYRACQEEWHCMGCDGESPYDLMLSTPPANEPVSVERSIELADGDLYILVTEDKMPDTWNAGDRVRVVKIEEPT